MKVVVDTSVWSLALRRNRLLEESPPILMLRKLIADDRVALLGAIRQELLSGIREVEQSVRLREYLRAFPNLELAKIMSWLLSSTTFAVATGFRGRSPGSGAFSISEN